MRFTGQSIRSPNAIRVALLVRSAFNISARSIRRARKLLELHPHRFAGGRFTGGTVRSLEKPRRSPLRARESYATGGPMPRYLVLLCAAALVAGAFGTTRAAAPT